MNEKNGNYENNEYNSEFLFQFFITVVKWNVDYVRLGPQKTQEKSQR